MSKTGQFWAHRAFKKGVPVTEEILVVVGVVVMVGLMYLALRENREEFGDGDDAEAEVEV